MIQTEATRSWNHVLVAKFSCLSRSKMSRNDKFRNINFILSSMRSYLCFLREFKWTNHAKRKSTGEQRDYRKQTLLGDYWKAREGTDRRQWWNGNRKKERDVTTKATIWGVGNKRISRSLKIWVGAKYMALLPLLPPKRIGEISRIKENTFSWGEVLEGHHVMKWKYSVKTNSLYFLKKWFEYQHFCSTEHCSYWNKSRKAKNIRIRNGEIKLSFFINDKTNL